jgi:hypothetical protein
LHVSIETKAATRLHRCGDKRCGNDPRRQDAIKIPVLGLQVANVSGRLSRRSAGRSGDHASVDISHGDELGQALVDKSLISCVHTGLAGHEGGPQHCRTCNFSDEIALQSHRHESTLRHQRAERVTGHHTALLLGEAIHGPWRGEVAWLGGFSADMRALAIIGAVAGWPIVSIDTKKKEILDDFFHPGQAYTNGRVVVASDERLVPYGVYEVRRNEGLMRLACDADTPELACDAIRS